MTKRNLVAVRPESRAAQIIKIPFYGSAIHSAKAGDQPVVVLKPTIEAMGLNYTTQIAKLKNRSWATISLWGTVGADGKQRDMSVIDLDGWVMFLANINENKVKPELRQTVIAYQKESAEALRKFWTEGGAINPAASRNQLERIQEQAANRIAEMKSYGTIRRSIKTAGGEGSDFADVQDLFYMTFFGTRAKTIVKRQPQLLGEPYKVGPKKGQLKPSSVAKDHLTPDQLVVLSNAVPAVNSILALRYPNGDASLSAIKSTIQEVGQWTRAVI